MRAFVFWAVAVCVFNGDTAFAQLQLNPSGHVKLEATSPAWKTILDAQAEIAAKPGKRQYSLNCKLSTGTGIVGSKQSTIADPQMIVTENQAGKLEQLKQTPYVTSVTVVSNSEDDSQTALQPVITVLDEGFTIEATITQVDETHAHIDGSLTLQKVSGVEEVKLARCTTQAPDHHSVTRRILRTVRFGEPQQLKVATTRSDKPLTFEYTVSLVVK